MGRKPIVEVLLQHVSGSITTWIALAIGAVTIYCIYKRKYGTTSQPPGMLTPPPRWTDATPPSHPSNTNDDSGVLARIYRQQFVGHKICIAWEALLEKGQLTEEAKGILRMFAFSSDVYLMCQISGDAEKMAILALVRDVEELLRHKILFCTTVKGYEAFARQLCPSLLITIYPSQASFLSGVLPYIVLVNSVNVIKGNVACVPTVAKLMCEDCT